MRATAVDAVIVKNNKILLLKLDKFPFYGKWALPGGLVEKNETVEQACIREAKEETGLCIEIQRLIGVFSKPERDPRGYISIAFLCSIANGIIKTNQEAKEAKFFHWDDLPEEIAFDHKLIIEQGRKYLHDGL